MEFTIKTWVDSRSNRRDRTYRIDADTAAVALYSAKAQACHGVRQNVTVLAEIADVDGHGAPQDCAHDDARFRKGFVRRADGGRDCRDCAELVTVWL